MSRRRVFDVVGVAVCVIVGIAAYRLGRARADGVPMVNPLYYGGMLDDGGRPIEGVRNVTVRLWDAATAGATVCTTNAAGTAFSGGRFRVALDGACVGAVRANPELWAELQVDATTFPRSKLGAVPYALEAGRATGAAGALEARLAAVEGRMGGRQVVIGSWRPTTPGESEMVAVPCPTPLPTTPTWIPLPGAIFTFTFTALATALYHISPLRVFVVDGSASYPTRLQGLPQRTFNLFNLETYLIEGGRTYTFSIEVQVGPTCRPMTASISAPFAIEQIN